VAIITFKKQPVSKKIYIQRMYLNQILTLSFDSTKKSFSLKPPVSADAPDVEAVRSAYQYFDPLIEDSIPDPAVIFPPFL